MVLFEGRLTKRYYSTTSISSALSNQIFIVRGARGNPRPYRDVRRETGKE
jgi:hypothetical protein